MGQRKGSHQDRRPDSRIQSIKQGKMCLHMRRRERTTQMMKKMKRTIALTATACILCIYRIISATAGNTDPVWAAQGMETPAGHFPTSSIPSYSGQPYVTVNGNIPYFTDAEMVTEPFETYSELDHLGRCGVAYANICRELMPTQKREAIGQVKPSGWHLARYDDIIEDKYLYNRCHLIGYQLAGENANERNLITGTRYLNVTGMLPFENKVANYVESTGNHVLYRVTPVFEGNNLLATGVLMEAKSVEDNGTGICFHVFAYNSQPGITIDYATGDSALSREMPLDTAKAKTPAVQETTAVGEVPIDAESADYILNTNTHKFHFPTCPSVGDMKEKNKKEFSGTRDEAVAQGYSPCKRCHP